MADKAPKDTSLQSTKQMLDELDALMERMLSMPVSELADASSPPPSDKPNGPSLSASLTLLEPPSDEADAVPTPRTSPALSTIAPPAKKPERRPRSKVHPAVKPPHVRPTMKMGPTLDESDEATPEPLSNQVVPPTLMPELEPLLDDTGNDAPNSARLPRVGPLLSMNQSFDASTMYLGGFGRWLRGRSGRAVIGFMGLCLLAAAGGWVVKDYLGWNWR